MFLEFSFQKVFGLMGEARSSGSKHKKVIITPMHLIIYLANFARNNNIQNRVLILPTGNRYQIISPILLIVH